MYIVFDIGGTQTRIAASRDGKTLKGEPVSFNTPAHFDEGIQQICEVARVLTEGSTIAGVSGGIGGPLNATKDALLSSADKENFLDWVGKPLVAKLSEKLKAPVFLANDAAIVGLGEAHAGAGMGYNIVAYITISTGVGGARIVNGKIDARVYGFEPGKQLIDIDHTMCPRCVSGTLEDMISGAATEMRFGIAPSELVNQKVWEEEIPKWLAYGLYNTILHWSPDVVVLGGSLMQKISISKTEMYLKEIATIYPSIPDIRMAELGSFGGMQGGLAYLRQQLRTQ